MKNMGVVRGSAAQAVPLIISKDTVYIHTNIHPVEGEEGLYEYHEVQYEKDEYIKLMSDQIKLMSDQNEILTETLDTLMSEVLPALMM